MYIGHKWRAVMLCSQLCLCYVCTILMMAMQCIVTDISSSQSVKLRYSLYIAHHKSRQSVLLTGAVKEHFFLYHVHHSLLYNLFDYCCYSL